MPLSFVTMFYGYVTIWSFVDDHLMKKVRLTRHLCKELKHDQDANNGVFCRAGHILTVCHHATHNLRYNVLLAIRFSWMPHTRTGLYLNYWYLILLCRNILITTIIAIFCSYLKWFIQHHIIIIYVILTVSLYVT